MAQAFLVAGHHCNYPVDLGFTDIGKYKREGEGDQGHSKRRKQMAKVTAHTWEANNRKHTGTMIQDWNKEKAHRHMTNSDMASLIANISMMDKMVATA